MKDEGIDDERDLPYDYAGVGEDFYCHGENMISDKNQRLYQQIWNAKKNQRRAELIKALEVPEPSWLDRLKKRIHEFLRR